MLNQSEHQKDGKVQKPAGRIIAYRHYKDSEGNDKSQNVEIGAAWATESGKGISLSFKITPMELLTGNCQLYIFPIEDKRE
ncbi:MAG: hypothetical protein DRR42_11215 [Gammaproteobacteria bacterium]|nr:MAG: hypothetical protein DRR42_11215 [Gammaproteobacteria bacterium]